MLKVATDLFWININNQIVIYPYHGSKSIVHYGQKHDKILLNIAAWTKPVFRYKIEHYKILNDHELEIELPVFSKRDILLCQKQT